MVAASVKYYLFMADQCQRPNNPNYLHFKDFVEHVKIVQRQIVKQILSNIDKSPFILLY